VRGVWFRGDADPDRDPAQYGRGHRRRIPRKCITAEAALPASRSATLARSVVIRPGAVDGDYDARRAGVQRTDGLPGDSVRARHRRADERERDGGRKRGARQVKMRPFVVMNASLRAGTALVTGARTRSHWG
jgi:hypothetical protein